MPCIQTKVNVKISREKEETLKSRFGKAIELLPGKSENWLMLTFEDNCRMYFKGTNQPGIAFVNVKIFGKADAGDFEKLTEVLTKIINEELGISPSRTYIQYEESQYWGWNGNNF